MKSNIEGLYHSLVKFGGGTYRFESNELNPDTGYMIAVEGKEIIVPVPADYEAFRQIIVDYTRKYHNEVFGSEKNNYLGVWINPENNMLYVDVSERVEDLTEALKLGRLRAQIAIFDNAAGEVINVKFAYVQEILNAHHIHSIITF